MNSFPQNSAIVLVHGAWADGSCWKDVVLPLERKGFEVICAPIPLTSLTDDMAALTRALERTSGPVVLAGHAYGGAVIGATREERVNRSFISQRSRLTRARPLQKCSIATKHIQRHVS